VAAAQVKEVVSLLREVMACTKSIQGGSGAFISQCIYLISLLFRTLSSPEFDIANFDRHAVDSNDSESEDDSGLELQMVMRGDLTAITRKMLDLLVSEGMQRRLGWGASSLERLAVTLDPRFKDKNKTLLGGSGALDLARAGLSSAYQTMKQARPGLATRPPPSAPAAGESAARPSKRRKEEHHTSYLDREEAKISSRQAAASAQAAASSSLASEVERYLAQAREPASLKFDILAYWRRKGTPQLDVETGITTPPEFPILSRVACQVFSVDATSCEAERNFSQLKLMVTRLRTRLSVLKVEMMLFLKLNMHLIPELARAPL
jgi:hypothetical protein